MTALVSRRRRRSVLMLLVTLLVVGAVPAMGYVGVRAILDSEGGTDAIKDNLPVTGFPSTPTALLATTDGAGRLTSTTVFVVDPTGSGGSIISVPVSADYGLADDRRISLQGAYSLGGIDETVLAVESVLGVTVNHYVEADHSQLAALLSPLGPIPVDLPGDVAGSGGLPAIPAGAAELDADQAAQVLTSLPPADGTGLEASRRPNVEETWVGVVRAIGSGSNTINVDSAIEPVSFQDVVDRVFTGTAQTRGLVAQALTVEQNPTGMDVEQLDRSEAVFVFASIAPGAVSAAADGPTYRLVAPPGFDAAVKTTINRMLFVQSNVLSVDTTGVPQPNTVFLVPDEVVRAEAQQTDGIFGDFTFGEPTERIDGIEVTIILGTDYLERTAAT